jgi:hypothetical protein
MKTPPPRRGNDLSGPKLQAKGTPTELQIVLQWELNTQGLYVTLPFNKFAAWSEDLETATKE